MVSDPKGVVPLEFILYFLGTKDHKALGLFSNFWGIYRLAWAPPKSAARSDILDKVRSFVRRIQIRMS